MHVANLWSPTSKVVCGTIHLLGKVTPMVSSFVPRLYLLAMQMIELSGLGIIYVVHVYGVCIEGKGIFLPPSPFSPKADLIFQGEEGYSTLPGKELNLDFWTSQLV